MGPLCIHYNMNLDSYLHIKINSKIIIDSNIRAKIIQLLEDNIGEYLLDLGLGNKFLDMTWKV